MGDDARILCPWGFSCLDEHCTVVVGYYFNNIKRFILFYLFQQYLDRGAQFREAGLNGALFNINLHTNNILQNTKFQITKVLTQ